MTHNNFAVYVPTNVSQEEAQPLADRILNWLIQQEIIQNDTSNCLPDNRKGYAPGAKALNYLEKDQQVNKFIRDHHAGFEVLIGRQTFDSGKVYEITCRECDHDIDMNEDGIWKPALEEWLLRKGPGEFTCQRCGHTEPLSKFYWDPHWAFGELGFKFWNWPRFTKQYNMLFDYMLEGKGFELVIG